MRAFLYLKAVLYCIVRERRGAVATEYAFLIVFIAIVAAIGMVTLGTDLRDYFITFGNALLGAADAVNPT